MKKCLYAILLAIAITRCADVEYKPDISRIPGDYFGDLKYYPTSDFDYNSIPLFVNSNVIATVIKDGDIYQLIIDKENMPVVIFDLCDYNESAAGFQYFRIIDALGFQQTYCTYKSDFFLLPLARGETSSYLKLKLKSDDVDSVFCLAYEGQIKPR